MATLSIFVGHASDAEPEAKLIKDLESQLQAEFRSRLRLVPNSTYQRLEVWIWEQDAPYQPGGQTAVVRPSLEECRIGVFIVKHRVGRVTSEELNHCRERRIPTLCFFSKQGPANQLDLQAQMNWVEVLKFKEDQSRDWTGKDSLAIRPLPDFESAEHLRQLALEHLVKAIVDCLQQEQSQQGIPSSAPESSNERGLDSRTRVRDFDVEIVRAFRRQMGDDPGLPAVLSEREFLGRLGVLSEDGYLTGVGVLLFAQWPHQVMASAATQCVVHADPNQKLTAQSSEFLGPLQTQFAHTMDLLYRIGGKRIQASNAALGLAAANRFPMKCLRELVLNGLCHREYHPGTSQLVVEMHPDCIEITSPGRWAGESPPPQGTWAPLSTVPTGRCPHNFRLTNLMGKVNPSPTSVGTGIARALADCSEHGAREPQLFQSPRFVKLRVFPAKPDRVLRVRVGDLTNEQLRLVMQALERAGLNTDGIVQNSSERDPKEKKR